MLNYPTSSNQIVNILSNKVSSIHLLKPCSGLCYDISLNLIFSVEKISKIISREVVEANIFNENLMSILAAFILQLSPFLDNNPMDDQRIVDEGKLLRTEIWKCRMSHTVWVTRFILFRQKAFTVTISIEAYFRCLSTERASAYNIYHPTLYESSLQILENIIRYVSYNL